MAQSDDDDDDRARCTCFEQVDAFGALVATALMDDDSEYAKWERISRNLNRTDSVRMAEIKAILYAIMQKQLGPN